MINMIKLISFDWSGVLSDDREPIYEANMRILEEYGKERIPFDTWLRETTLTPIGFLRNHGVHAEPNELFSSYIKHFNEVIESGITPTVYPNANKTLKYLQQKGYILVVLSSHPRQNLLKELKEYSLLEFFTDIFGESKDKTIGLKQIAEKFQLQPIEILHIGDMVYDIRAAKKAGTKSAGICTGYHSKERLKAENPDYLFNSLDEVMNVL
jgi:phosphoglycolate phosphatase